MTEITVSEVFSMSDSLRVFDRDGSSLEAPLDSPVPGPNLLIQGSESVKDFNLPVLLQHAERLRHGSRITGFALIAVGGFHRIFEVTFDSAEALIARITLATSDNPIPRPNGWNEQKMRGEVAVLNLLAQRAPRVPVPKVFASDTHTSSEGNAVGVPWMLMEKVPGVPLSRVYSKLSLPAKLALGLDLAEVLAATFKISSAVVGSVVDLDDLFNPILGSIIMPTDPISSVCLGPGQLSLRDIFKSRLTARITNSTSPGDSVSSSVVDSFLYAIQHFDTGLAATDFRLTHLDLRMDNIFVIPGPRGLPVVSGILDWEFHAFLPSQLAAQFPLWLRYDGFYDPRFNPTNAALTWYWEERSDIAQELRDMFLDAIRKHDISMFNAYQNGALARQISSWLDHWVDEPGYRSGLSSWMTSVL